ncbi:MAG: HNH endonuclease [Bacteroidota bacterium]
MYSFRSKAPRRTYVGPELSHYRKYKKQLRSDFNGRCGYTDCRDFWFGGVSTFQIDHFKPKSKYPDLTTTYDNLVYSCSFANNAKGSDYNDELYLDPCKIDYNDHFERDDYGQILPKTSSQAAQYMYKKMKLYLKRYGIIWTLDQLQEKIKAVHRAIEKVKEEEKRKVLLQLSYDLSQSLQEYLDYLALNQ